MRQWHARARARDARDAKLAGAKRQPVFSRDRGVWNNRPPHTLAATLATDLTPTNPPPHATPLTAAIYMHLCHPIATSDTIRATLPVAAHPLRARCESPMKAAKNTLSTAARTLRRETHASLAHSCNSCAAPHWLIGRSRAKMTIFPSFLPIFNENS